MDDIKNVEFVHDNDDINNGYKKFHLRVFFF